jgi:Fe-S cluster assembly scaffold protein SufB
VGNEQESVLLMSPDVINKTLPIILCEEEDVEGAHGATIGRLSEDMLFYMTSRGIDRKTAERIIVRARLDAVAAKVPVPALKEKLTAFIEETFSDEHAD